MPQEKGGEGGGNKQHIKQEQLPKYPRVIMHTYSFSQVFWDPSVWWEFSIHVAADFWIISLLWISKLIKQWLFQEKEGKRSKYSRHRLLHSYLHYASTNYFRNIILW